MLCCLPRSGGLASAATLDDDFSACQALPWPKRPSQNSVWM